jgi:hypothetical protein
MNSLEIKKKIGIESNIELWQLVKDDYKYNQSGELVKTKVKILNIVNTETGEIEEFELIDKHIHEGIKNNETSTKQLFGCNGYKRLRTAEYGLKEIEY